MLDDRVGGQISDEGHDVCKLARLVGRWDACGLFERFTPAARTAVAEAQTEARELRHNHVGVEHLLLGVLREHDSAAAEILRSRGVSLERVRERVLEIVGPGDREMPPGTHAPFTPRAKKVLELSLREALSHGSMAVDTEHLVLGIARESDSIAMRLLTEEWGLSAQALRDLFPAPAPVVATVRRPCDSAGVFERFTERGRQAVVAAQEEARELRTGHVGSEALLLGLLREDAGLAARVLASFDVTLERARAQVVRRVSVGDGPAPPGQIPFTPRAKQVLERAVQEGLELGHNYVGTEHLLLGIAEVDEGVAIEVLRDFDLDSQKIRDAVIGLLSGAEPDPETQRGRSRPPMPHWRGGRRVTRATGIASPGPAGGFRVEPGDDVVRLLMGAAARALEDGRTEMSATDLLIALSRDEQTGPLLGKLGAGEPAIRAALDDQATSNGPPEAATGS
jgi:hypothetical protein